ncbi:MAG: hypothetical protein V2I43_27770, partial [Parvularcula sp.]|nr:hypothetical protein [Parvularcula sp.]
MGEHDKIDHTGLTVDRRAIGGLSASAHAVCLGILTGGLALPWWAARSERAEVERHRFAGVPLHAGASLRRYILPTLLILLPLWIGLLIFTAETDLYAIFVVRPWAAALYVGASWASLAAGLWLMQQQRRASLGRARWLGKSIASFGGARGNLASQRSAIADELTSVLAADPDLRTRLQTRGPLALRPDGTLARASLKREGITLGLIDEDDRRVLAFDDVSKVARRSLTSGSSILTFADGSVF